MNESIINDMTNYFDSMLGMTSSFKKKEYANVFEKMNKEFGGLFKEIAGMFNGELSEEASNSLIDELSMAIPKHAKAKMNAMSKKDQEKKAIDFNMNMAVYIIPGLSYSNNEKLIAIAKKSVENWNEIKVTNLQLSYSRYEDIDGGFKRKLCFITTAVCEAYKKPDDCYELRTLRDFRDDYLLDTLEGTALVEEYYDIAPAIVMMINMEQDSDLYSSLYNDYISPCINDIENDNKEICKNRYIDMVNALKTRYYH